MPFQLAFKALKQGKGISRSPRESGEDLVVVKPAYLAGASLCYNGAQGYLAIASEGDLVPASSRKYGCTVMFWHG